MLCTRPLTEIMLAGLAGSTVLTVALAPPTPWLAPDVHPLALTLSAAWAAWRLLALDRALAQRRVWHQAPGWILTPKALASATAPPGGPPGYAAGGAVVVGIVGSCWDGPFAGTPGTRRC